jgi:hypothetical protein
MPRCAGKPVQPAMGGFEFQVDLAHDTRHFAPTFRLIHEIDPFPSFVMLNPSCYNEAK